MLEDESGFFLVSLLKRSWARRAHPPTIRTSPARHQSLNLLSALLISPDGHKIKLDIRFYRHSLCGEQVIVFSEQMLRTIPGEIVSVLDNQPIHKRCLVQDFMAQHPPLHVYHCPIYAPELTPVEFVRTRGSGQTANFTPHKKTELCTRGWNGGEPTRNSARRLAACLAGCELSWKGS